LSDILNGIRDLNLTQVDPDLIKQLISDTRKFTLTDNQMEPTQIKQFNDWFQNIYYSWAFLSIVCGYKDFDGISSLLYDLTAFFLVKKSTDLTMVHLCQISKALCFVAPTQL